MKITNWKENVYWEDQYREICFFVNSSSIWNHNIAPFCPSERMQVELCFWNHAPVRFLQLHSKGWLLCFKCFMAAVAVNLKLVIVSRFKTLQLVSSTFILYHIWCQIFQQQLYQTTIIHVNTIITLLMSCLPIMPFFMWATAHVWKQKPSVSLWETYAVLIKRSY